jgi:hypothetical protein
MGRAPYGILPTVEIVTSIMSGVRLAQPAHCPDNVYVILHESVSCLVLQNSRDLLMSLVPLPLSIFECTLLGPSLYV